MFIFLNLNGNLSPVVRIAQGEKKAGYTARQVTSRWELGTDYDEFCLSSILAEAVMLEFTVTAIKKIVIDLQTAGPDRPRCRMVDASSFQHVFGILSCKSRHPLSALSLRHHLSPENSPFPFLSSLYQPENILDL